MKQKITFSIISILYCVWFAPALSAQNAPNQNDLLRALIDLPAPRPKVKDADENKERPSEFYDDKNIPPDDAPLKDLLDYWQSKAAGSYYGDNKPPQISAESINRLLTQIDRTPEKLSDYLKILPATPETAEKVKSIYDRQAAVEGWDGWRKNVKEWLKFNSKFYVDELFATAQKAEDSAKYGSVEKTDELKALARIDWERAKPLLESFAENTNQPRTAVFAKRLLYKNAFVVKDDTRIEKYRTELKAVVENKNASGSERDIAFDALTLNKEWQGFDDWYLSLFSDETFLELRLSENIVSNPLNSVVAKNPDKWIPIVSKFVGDKNHSVHNAAVNSLIQFTGRDSRKDALESLLPLLENPEWANVSGQEWIGLVQSMDEVDLPESVPSLIKILETEKGIFRAWTARALAKYKESKAVPALKFALGDEPEEENRNHIINSLIASNGLSDVEMVNLLELYAKATLNPELAEQIENRNQYQDENPLPVEISIGKYLSKQYSPSDNFIHLLFERVKTLQKSKPEVAKKLLEIAGKWRGKAVDAELLERIRDGKADINLILSVLARRKDLRESSPLEVSWLVGKNGLARALGAAIYEDEAQMMSIIAQTDAEAEIAALAFARLLRIKLPVPAIGNLLDDKNKLIALAAERYLEAEDSKEARNLVLSKHPNEAKILGARDSFNPTKQTGRGWSTPLGELFASIGSYFYDEDYHCLDEFSEKLRRETLENPDLLEVYAHLPNWEAGQKVVRIYKNRATFTVYDDKARYREKNLTKDELDSFRAFLTEMNLDEFEPKSVNCHNNCYKREFISLTKNSGRRIYDGSGFGALGDLDILESRFDSGRFRLRYFLQDKIAGLEILLADEKFNVHAVWKQADDFRVLVEDNARKEQIEEEIQKQDNLDDENEDLDWEERGKQARKRRAERQFEHFAWRKFINGELGEIVEQPKDVPFLKDETQFGEVEELDSDNHGWQARAGDFEIRAGNYNKGGLWKVNRTQIIQIREGQYDKPITTPDGKWVVAAKAKENWSPPNDVVRLNLQTGKESRINLPPADNFYPIAFVASHNKILLYRARDENSSTSKDNPSPAAPEYFLLDAATGTTELVKGEFQPLARLTYRFLQPSGKPNEFWAAVYNRQKNESEIGVYDTRNFAFKPVQKIPDILLDSMDVWVDETEGKIYFVYGGDFRRQSHLLAVPLTNNNHF